MKMAINFTIRQKIQTYILGTVVLVYLVVFGFISISNRKAVLSETSQMIDTDAEYYAQKIGTTLNNKMATLRAIANSTIIDKDLPIDQFMALKNKMLNNVIAADSSIYSLWDSWEYSYIKPGWDKDYGRTCYTIWKEGNGYKNEIAERSLDGDAAAYAYGKTLCKEYSDEPYLDNFSENKAEVKMMTSLSVPVVRNGKYVGVIAEDLTLDQFQTLLEGMKLFEGSSPVLVSQKGTIVSYKDKKQLNKNITDVFNLTGRYADVVDKIGKGETFSYTFADANGEEYYYSFAPITIGKDGATVWSFGISIPMKIIYAKANHEFLISILVGLFGLFIIWLITIMLAKSITDPIKRITTLLGKMGEGDVDKKMKMEVKGKDEISSMSIALNRMIDSLVEKEEFASHIGKGNLDIELNLISSNDKLGTALVQMQNDLVNAKDVEDERRQEEKKQRWLAEGVARINEVVYSNHNIKDMARVIVKEIATYVGSEQAGFFLINDENEGEVTYDLIAAFAYNRHRMHKKSIVVGEGVIGACIAEKAEIYLKEMPNEYVEITSGLGGSNPNNLFIVPLLYKDNVLGVIELIAFKIFDKYDKEFILKAAETIASAIFFARNNEKTNILLQQFKEQSEMLASQEEEMRQNLEELRTTQEESNRQQQDLSTMLDAFSKASLWVEYDLDGNAVKNCGRTAFIQGVTDDVLQANIFQNKALVSLDTDTIKNIWNSVQGGGTRRVKNTRTIYGKERVFVDSYLPVKNEGKVEKVLFVSFDITEHLN